ncbi:hypothetical protein YC2023_107342 [Brassica napus]
MEKRLDHTRIHRSKIKQLSIFFKKLHLLLIQIHPRFNPTTFFRVNKRHNVLLSNRRKRKPNRFTPTEINFIQTEPTRARQYVEIKTSARDHIPRFFLVVTDDLRRVSVSDKLRYVLISKPLFRSPYLRNQSLKLSLFLSFLCFRCKVAHEVPDRVLRERRRDARA